MMSDVGINIAARGKNKLNELNLLMFCGIHKWDAGPLASREKERCSTGGQLNSMKMRI
jgi:hypothetical protein